MPGRPQVEDGDDDVDRTEDRGDAENVDREDGEIDPHASLHRERRIERPAGIHRTITNPEQCQDEGQRQQYRGRRQQPETPVVDARQGHVRGADHQGNLPVGKTGRGGHQRRKNHHQRVHADQLIEELGLHQL
jgi:hypothetical protein